MLATSHTMTVEAVAAPDRRHASGFTTRQIAVRLFLTSWIVFTLHFSSNSAREIFPALAIGDHLSFRVDDYANMHPDLFEKKGYGWHIGNNPGASMLAAIPYALARPIIDRVVERARRGRAAVAEPPAYNSPWPMAREFYREAWKRGLDLKLGLGAFVMQAFCMAPLSAAAIVVMFLVLRLVLGSDRGALWLSLLYAFGTPVLFRTGYLNQNLMLGHFAFMGFAVMWNPGGLTRWSSRTRFLIGGLAGGAAVLLDYSGVVLLLALFGYGLAQRWNRDSPADAVRHGAYYVAGSIPPILLLWFYQWQSFGNPFLPGQHWMPPVEWIELGYRGYGLPQLELLWMLLFDYRFGLFVASPLMLLALAAPFVDRGVDRRVPQREQALMLLAFVGMWVFFSGSNYVRLQFNTGIRYMTAILPFMFVLVATVWVRLPRPARWLLALGAVAEAWPLAMHRDVESGLGMLNPMLHVFLGGFELPALTTLSNMAMFRQWFDGTPSPLPLFALAAALFAIIWVRPQRSVSQSSGA
jgi:hypothetical protein